MSAAARTDGRLALYAADEADLAVVAACLQDALVHRADMTFDAKMRRFALVASRIRNEDGARAASRTRTGLHFDDVTRAQVRGLPAGDATPLVLLTVSAAPADGGGAVITLIFAGDAQVRLEADCIAASLRDLGAPWTTTNRPDHGLES